MRDEAWLPWQPLKACSAGLWAFGEDGEGLGDGEGRRESKCLPGPTRWRAERWGRAGCGQGRSGRVKGNSWRLGASSSLLHVCLGIGAQGRMKPSGVGIYVCGTEALCDTVTHVCACEAAWYVCVYLARTG
jgi:hypothetical protein